MADLPLQSVAQLFVLPSGISLPLPRQLFEDATCYLLVIGLVHPGDDFLDVLVDLLPPEDHLSEPHPVSFAIGVYVSLQRL